MLGSQLESMATLEQVLQDFEERRQRSFFCGTFSLFPCYLILKAWPISARQCYIPVFLYLRAGLCHDKRKGREALHFHAFICLCNEKNVFMTAEESTSSSDGKTKRMFVLRKPKFPKHEGFLQQVPGHPFSARIHSQVPERWRETLHRNYMTASLDMLRHILLSITKIKEAQVCILNLGNAEWLIYDKNCCKDDGPCLIIHTLWEESTHSLETGEFMPSIKFRLSNLKDETRQRLGTIHKGISIPEVYGRYAYAYFKKLKWQHGMAARMGIVTKVLPKLPDEIHRHIANAYGDAKFTLREDSIKGLFVDPFAVRKAMEQTMESKKEVRVACCFSKGINNRVNLVEKFFNIFAAEFSGSGRTIFDIRLSRAPHRHRASIAIMVNRQKESTSSMHKSSTSSFVVLDFLPKDKCIHVHCLQSLARKQMKIVSGSARCMWGTPGGLGLLASLAVL